MHIDANIRIRPKKKKYNKAYIDWILYIDIHSNLNITGFPSTQMLAQLHLTDNEHRLTSSLL